MANQLRVTLEIGPKGKKVVAVAPDWPGLERGAKTEEAAIGTVTLLPSTLCTGGEAGWDGGRVCGQHHRRRGRALSGHGLNRLLGHLVRVFGASTGKPCRAKNWSVN